MSRNALEVAQEYVRLIETGERDSLAACLSDDVRQIFPISAEATGEPQAIFVGKAEVLDYTYGLFRKFQRLHWPNPQWTISADGNRAFLEARGDAQVTHSGIRYQNVYITRFDVKDGLIVEIAEYANSALYMSLGIDPTENEMRAGQRAQGAK